MEGMHAFEQPIIASLYCEHILGTIQRLGQALQMIAGFEHLHVWDLDKLQHFSFNSA